MEDLHCKFDINKVFTPKQQEYLRTPDKRINILMGSVRSGKTYISLFKFAMRVKYSPKDCVYMFLALTSTTLKRNVLNTLEEIVGRGNLQYSMSKKDGTLFGHKILLEYAPDERSEGKIRGLTLDGAYADELTLYPETFFQMLLSRLSRPNAVLYATTNPDTPTHWLKVKYIDREDELDLKTWMFRIDDNTFLEKRYLDSLKKEYTGVFYQRFILGLWVIADGLVMSEFNRDTMVIDPVPLEKIISDYDNLTVGMDYGIQNPTAMVLFGWHRSLREWHVLKDYERGGREGEPALSDPEIYEDLKRFTENLAIERIILDPSAESMQQLIRKDARFRVFDADNNVLKGIAFVNTMFNQGKLKICRNCTKVLDEIYSYHWDIERSRKTGTDCVCKESDHTMDALRYCCATVVYPRARAFGVYFDATHYDNTHDGTYENWRTR